MPELVHERLLEISDAEGRSFRRVLVYAERQPEGIWAAWVEFVSASGDRVYIELRLEGTIGRRRFTMHTCDRIRLRDGKAFERVAYLDATPLVKAVLRSPRAWPVFVRSQLRNLRRPT